MILCELVSMLFMWVTILCMCVYTHIHTNTHRMQIIIGRLGAFCIFISHTYMHTYIHTYIHIHILQQAMGDAFKDFLGPGASAPVNSCMQFQLSTHIYIRANKHAYIHTHTHIMTGHGSCLQGLLGAFCISSSQLIHAAPPLVCLVCRHNASQRVRPRSPICPTAGGHVLK
jgi:hypothetical protein